MGYTKDYAQGICIAMCGLAYGSAYACRQQRILQCIVARLFPTYHMVCGTSNINLYMYIEYPHMEERQVVRICAHPAE